MKQKTIIAGGALLAIMALAWALRYTDVSHLVDLPIIPDSPQYAISGYNLAHGMGLWIYINSLKLPLQYPPGFPLILSLFYRLTGAALHQAIYVVLIFSLLSITLLYLFVKEVFNRVTALLAALLLTLAPLYVGYSQVVISDMVSNTFILLGLWLTWRAATRDNAPAWLWVAAGASCGFSATVHMLSGITIVPLVVACALSANGNPRPAIRLLALTVTGFLIGFLPVLIYNQIAFGNVFQTGYNYWARWGEGEQNFSLHYAFANTAVSERGDNRANIAYYLWHFFGLSWPTLFAPYFPGVLVLAVWGVFSSLKKRGKNYPSHFERDNPLAGEWTFAWISISLIIAVMLVLFFYSFQMSKFLLPFVPFVCALAAHGVVSLTVRFRGSEARARLARVPIGLLIAVTAWGCAKPYLEGAHRSRPPTWWYEGLQELDRIAPDNACLISGIDGVYVTHHFIRNSSRIYLPISREVEYIRQRDLPLIVATEQPEMVAILLQSGKKVYLDGFTYNWWGRYRAVLENHFTLSPVASYYHGTLTMYELRENGS